MRRAQHKITGLGEKSTISIAPAQMPYTATVSLHSRATVPDDAAAKSHHVKSGVGCQ